MSGGEEILKKILKDAWCVVTNMSLSAIDGSPKYDTWVYTSKDMSLL